MIGQIVFVQYSISRANHGMQQTSGIIQTVYAEYLVISKANFFQPFDDRFHAVLAYNNGNIHAVFHSTAKITVVFCLLLTKFHHTGCDDDAAFREGLKHIQRSLCANRVGIKRVIDNGEPAGTGDQFQTVFYGLKFVDAMADLLERQPQIAGNSRSQQDVLQAVLAQQTGLAINAAFPLDVQRKIAAQRRYAHVIAPYIAGFGIASAENLGLGGLIIQLLADGAVVVEVGAASFLR